MHGDEGRPHGHLGLAEAHVAADQAIHGRARQHVLVHRLDGGLLVRGLLEGEAGGEGGVVGCRVLEGIALARGAAGIDVEQLGGHVPYLFGGLALGLLPGFGAQLVQGRQGVVGARVAGDQVQVGHRHVQLGVVGIFEQQEFLGLIVQLQGDQTHVAAHAVVDVHHRRAFAQLGEVLDDVLAGVTTLLAAAALHDALAEQRVLRDQCDAGLIQHQAFVQRCQGDGDTFGAGLKGRPAFDLTGAQVQPGQEVQQHLAAAGAFRGEQHATGEVGDEVLQRRQGLAGLGIDG